MNYSSSSQQSSYVLEENGKRRKISINNDNNQSRAKIQLINNNYSAPLINTDSKHRVSAHRTSNNNEAKKTTIKLQKYNFSDQEKMLEMAKVSHMLRSIDNYENWGLTELVTDQVQTLDNVLSTLKRNYRYGLLNTTNYLCNDTQMRCSLYHRCIEIIVEDYNYYSNLASIYDGLENRNCSFLLNMRQSWPQRREQQKSLIISHMNIFKLLLSKYKLNPFASNIKCAHAQWCSINYIKTSSKSDLKTTAKGNEEIPNLNIFKIEILQNITNTEKNDHILAMIDIQIDSNPNVGRIQNDGTYDNESAIALTNNIMCKMFDENLENIKPSEMKYALENIVMYDLVRFTDVTHITNNDQNNACTNAFLRPMKTCFLVQLANVIETIYAALLLMNNSAVYNHQLLINETNLSSRNHKNMQVLCTLFIMKEYYQQWKCEWMMKTKTVLQLFLNRDISHMILNEYCFQDISILNDATIIDQEKWKYIYVNYSMEIDLDSEWVKWYKINQK